MTKMKASVAQPYRMKSGDVQAVRRAGPDDVEQDQIIIDWVRDSGGHAERRSIGYSSLDGLPISTIWVDGPGGGSFAHGGDWVVRTDTAFTVIPDRVFNQQYESAT